MPLFDSISSLLITNPSFRTFSVDSSQTQQSLAVSINSAPKNVTPFPSDASEIRKLYTEELECLKERGDAWLREGRCKEDVARKMHSQRRNIAERFRERTPERLRGVLYERNERKYGDPLGPSFEHLVKSWESAGLHGDDVFEQIIASSSRSNQEINSIAAGVFSVASLWNFLAGKF